MAFIPEVGWAVALHTIKMEPRFIQQQPNHKTKKFCRHWGERNEDRSRRKCIEIPNQVKEMGDYDDSYRVSHFCGISTPSSTRHS